MAFGKDTKILDKTPRFGSREMREALSSSRPNTEKKSGGNFGPYIRNLIMAPGKPYKIIIHPQTHKNTVFENGELVVRDLPYLRTFQHWVNNRRRFGTCSAPLYQDRDMQEARVARCGGCMAHAKQWVEVVKGGKKTWENQGPVSRANECFNFSVTVLGPFYEVASNKINPKTNLPYPEYVLRHDKRVQEAVNQKKLDQLATVPAQKYIWSLSRKDTSLLFGDSSLEPGTCLDDQINHICTACFSEEVFLESNRAKDGTLKCAACGASEDFRMSLLGKVLSLQATVSEPPKVPGGRPKTVLQFSRNKEFPQGWGPIPTDLEPEWLEPVNLAEKCYPLPSEMHFDLYGYAPEITESGADTSLVAASGEEDDEIPFLEVQGMSQKPESGDPSQLIPFTFRIPKGLVEALDTWLEVYTIKE